MGLVPSLPIYWFGKVMSKYSWRGTIKCTGALLWCRHIHLRTARGKFFRKSGNVSSRISNMFVWSDKEKTHKGLTGDHWGCSLNVDVKLNILFTGMCEVWIFLCTHNWCGYKQIIFGETCLVRKQQKAGKICRSSTSPWKIKSLSHNTCTFCWW